MLLLACVPCVMGQSPQNDGRVVRLLDDTRFERGFTVWSPAPGRHVREGEIQQNESTEKPVWGLAQWHSRFTLAEAKRESLPGDRVRFFDGAKAVTFFPPGAEADISLESILQKRSEIAATQDPHGRSGAPVSLVLITYAATEASIRSALEKISGDGLIAEPPQVIRIERE